MSRQEFFNGRDCNLRGAAIREVKFARRYTTEGDAPQIISGGKFQARFIAGGKLIFFDRSRLAILFDNRSDGVQNKFTRQVESRRNLRGAGRFVVTLCRHNFIASVAQLKPRRRVNRVIYATVQRNKATQKFFVGGVDNRVDLKARDEIFTIPRSETSADNNSSCKRKKFLSSGMGGRTFINARKSFRCEVKSSGTSSISSCGISLSKRAFKYFISVNRFITNSP